MSGATVEQTTYEGEPALRLVSGSLSFTVLPGLGLTGVSLVHHDGEFLAMPGGTSALREGRTTGFPLVAPWVNRLSGPRYRFGGVDVDLTEALADGTVRTDGNGLPIHGLVCGRSRWTVEDSGTEADAAHLRASLDVDHPAFPFPHRLTVTFLVAPDTIEVTTLIEATGDRDVPLAYGWHPYLVVPGTPRERWRLRTPAWQHLQLDSRNLPSGAGQEEPAADEPLGARTFDDLYAFIDLEDPAGTTTAFEGEDGRAVTVVAGEGYTHAQVWVPEGKEFAALEPMAAATDALTTGSAPVVPRGGHSTSRFALRLAPPR